MKEIKFRLRIGNEIIGYERWHKGNGSNAHWEHLKIGETVWQPAFLYATDRDLYIGLHDRRQKEIYDGDKVEFKEIEVDNGKFSGKTRIWFRHGCFVLDKVGFHAEGLGFYTPSLYEIDEKKLEVLEVRNK